MTTAADAQKELAKRSRPELAAFQRRFFRTEKGGYAEGDQFRGMKVPTIRLIARDFRALPLPEIRRLLFSEWHEDRMLALVVLVHQAERAGPDAGRRLAAFYLKNRKGVNNWDLVDLSAPALLGPFVEELEPTLDALSRSSNVWDRRISILAHFREVRAGDAARFFAFAPRFLADGHDLIHKAVGWLLREGGHKQPAKLKAFLDQHAKRMPRTMLRYAIEKLPETERKRYMART